MKKEKSQRHYRNTKSKRLLGTPIPNHNFLRGWRILGLSMTFFIETLWVSTPSCYLISLITNKIKASAVVEFQHSSFRLSQNCRFHGCLQTLELVPRVFSLVSAFINTAEVILMRLVLILIQSKVLTTPN